jgi:GT2 family glycosyltransferase
LKLAAHDRILILDNDVVLPEDPDWLNRLWEGLEQDAHIGIIGPMLVFARHPEWVQATGIGLTDRGRVGYLNRAARVENIAPRHLQVAASPSACWLVRKQAQQSVGLFSEEFNPGHYEDVDFCLGLGRAGWKIVCDCRVRVKHIENVTSRNLKGDSYTRVAVQNWIKFREKWAELLPQLASISEDQIYWGPIPPLETNPPRPPPTG